MSENFPNQPLESGYEGDKSPQFDHVIRRIRDSFAKAYFSPVQREKLYEGKENLSKQVDTLCWELAMKPDTFRQAVNLRALFLVRQLEVASRVTASDESWTYTISSDSFWTEVDKGMNAYLHKNADRMHHDSEVHEKIIGHNDDIVLAEQNIAEMNGRVICRQTMRNITSDAPHTIIYSVTPLGA